MDSYYIRRLTDAQLQKALQRKGGVLIQGPKGCGKTETAKQQAKSVLNVETDPSVPLAMSTDPGYLLRGDTPRLVDEWQVQPRLWDFARHEIDARRAKGQFIFTGSTAPAERVAHHSGAGRFARLTMSTMTLFETGESDGSASLQAIAEGEDLGFGVPELTIEQLAERMCRGGWPDDIDLPIEEAMISVGEYIDTVVEVDIQTPDGVRRNPERARALIRSLARGVGTEIETTTMATDVAVSRPTVADYLDALARIFISVDQPAWSTHLRSRARLRKTPKRHLADPALAMAALGRGPRQLLQDPRYFGQLFESFVVHELRALTGCPVYHARLNTQLEVDAVATVGDKEILVEVKLGYSPEILDQAAASLTRFSENLDLAGKRPVLLIITSGGPVHVRQDGVVVVPIGALGP